MHGIFLLSLFKVAHKNHKLLKILLRIFDYRRLQRASSANIPLLDTSNMRLSTDEVVQNIKNAVY